MISNRQKGFLLIEIIIYFALFSLIVAVSVVSTFSLLGSREKMRETSLIEEEAAFILAKIDWALSNSIIIEPELGQSDGKLVVRKMDFPDNPIIFEERDGNIFYETANISEPLSNSYLKVGNLNFDYRLFSESVPSLEAEFVINNRLFKTIHFDLISE